MPCLEVQTMSCRIKKKTSMTKQFFLQVQLNHLQSDPMNVSLLNTNQIQNFTWRAYSDPPIMADQPVMSFQTLLQTLFITPGITTQYTQFYVSIKSAIKNAKRQKVFPGEYYPRSFLIFLSAQPKAIKLFRNLKAIEIFCVPPV